VCSRHGRLAICSSMILVIQGNILMGLTIVVEHVFVGFIGPMNETTIEVNMPRIEHSKNPESVYIWRL
jgi:hypothetical protein